MKYRYFKECGRNMIFMNIVEDRDGELYLLKYCALGDKIWITSENGLYKPYVLAINVEEILEEDFFLEFL